MLFRKADGKVDLDFRTPEGFEQLYHVHVRDLYMICYQQLKDKLSCQEIVQDVFRSLWERRDTLVLNGPVEHYLKRAVKLKVIDHIRQKQRDTHHLECALADFCPSENSTEDTVHLHELEDKLGHLVDRLPCRCRQVYRLSREEGLSIQEIASSMLISENTVKVHLTKALNILKKNLPEYANL